MMNLLSGSAFKMGKHLGFWFRICGYGLAVSTMTPMFSERNGYRRTVRIFGVKLEALTP